MAMQQLGPGLTIPLLVLPWLAVLLCYLPLLLILLWPVSIFLEFVDLIFELTGLIPLSSYFVAGYSDKGRILFTFMDPVYFFTIMYLIFSAMIKRNEFISALKENPFLTLFLLMVITYIIIYTPIYGKSAIGEARKIFFPFFFPLLVVLSVKDFRDLRKIAFSVLFLSIGISLVGLLVFVFGRWQGHGLPSESVLILLLACISIVVLYVNGIIITNKIIYTIMMFVFGSLIIITLHRSVFIAAMFGLCLLFWMYRYDLRFLLKGVVILSCIVIMMGIVMTVIPSLEHSYLIGLRGIIDPHADSNASWRLKGWEQQWNRVVEENLLFGEGLGGYYEWLYKGKAVRVSPHNAYLQLVLKFGLLGLVVYGLLAFRFFHKALNVRKKLPPGPMRACVDMGILNFGAAHGYLIAYGFSPTMLIFVGVAMGAMRLLTHSRRGFETDLAQDILCLYERKPCIPRFI